MSLRVYLGDLRYNYSGVLANDGMPLGVAYMKAVMDREDTAGEINSRLFAYPERLAEALASDPPDVLMLSNYRWNEDLSHQLFRMAKRINPRVLNVMGGPNIPNEPERQVEYLEKHPDLDVYVLGEGDFLANFIVQTYMDAGLSISRLGAAVIPSSVYRNPEGQAVINLTRPRHKEVEEIPSPWLTGIQDEFFDGRLAPLIETNRGCPFSCTFCVQGTAFYTKVNNFPMERVREELHYIARRIKDLSPTMGSLRIADANYGMFERDIEISRFIGQMQRDYGWPTFIDASTGKNRADRVIKSVEEVSGALVLYQSVQSLDEDVLRTVKRSNIKLEAYKALEVYMRGRGLKSNSDVILGLPGESLKSHLTGLHALLDSNINHIHNFQAMMLKGSEMETLESRRTFKFGTGFRVLPKNFGIYGGDKVFDVEEIVVATDTMPFDDYVTARKWHLVSSVFWNDGWFDDVTRFLREHGISNSEWWSRMLPAMENGSEVMREFLDSFVAETTGELFPTREACIEFYSRDDNFEKLLNGDIGDNLMYRYRAIAKFRIWDEVCSAAMDATRQLLEERGVPEKIAGFDTFWSDFHTYVHHRQISGAEKSAILEPSRAQFHYDIPAWLAQAELGDPNAYRFSEPVEFEFRLSRENHHEVERSLDLWTTELKGLLKMITRVRVQYQVRDCIPAATWAAVAM